MKHNIWACDVPGCDWQMDEVKMTENMPHTDYHLKYYYSKAAPSIDVGMDAKEWSAFLLSWDEYCRCSNISEDLQSLKLIQSASEELRDIVLWDNQAYNVVEFDPEEVLAELRKGAVDHHYESSEEESSDEEEEEEVPKKVVAKNEADLPIDLSNRVHIGPFFPLLSIHEYYNYTFSDQRPSGLHNSNGMERNETAPKPAAAAAEKVVAAKKAESSSEEESRDEEEGAPKKVVAKTKAAPKPAAAAAKKVADLSPSFVPEEVSIARYLDDEEFFDEILRELEEDRMIAPKPADEAAKEVAVAKKVESLSEEESSQEESFDDADEAAKEVAVAKKAESSSEEEPREEESSDEAPKPAAAAAKKVAAAKKSESSSEEESSDEEESFDDAEEAAEKVAVAKKSESSYEEEEEAPKKVVAKKQAKTKADDTSGTSTCLQTPNQCPECKRELQNEDDSTTPRHRDWKCMAHLWKGYESRFSVCSCCGFIKQQPKDEPYRGTFALMMSMLVDSKQEVMETNETAPKPAAAAAEKVAAAKKAESSSEEESSDEEEETPKKVVAKNEAAPKPAAAAAKKVADPPSFVSIRLFEEFRRVSIAPYLDDDDDEFYENILRELEEDRMIAPKPADEAAKEVAVAKKVESLSEEESSQEESFDDANEAAKEVAVAKKAESSSEAPKPAAAKKVAVAKKSESSSEEESRDEEESFLEEESSNEEEETPKKVVAKTKADDGRSTCPGLFRLQTPYHCPECERQFYNDDSLRVHMRAHRK